MKTSESLSLTLVFAFMHARTEEFKFSETQDNSEWNKERFRAVGRALI